MSWCDGTSQFGKSSSVDSFRFLDGLVFDAKRWAMGDTVVAPSNSVAAPDVTALRGEEATSIYITLAERKCGGRAH
jgi:hypothetical protein